MTTKDIIGDIDSILGSTEWAEWDARAALADIDYIPRTPAEVIDLLLPARCGWQSQPKRDFHLEETVSIDEFNSWYSSYAKDIQAGLLEWSQEWSVATADQQRWTLERHIPAVIRNIDPDALDSPEYRWKREAAREIVLYLEDHVEAWKPFLGRAVRPPVTPWVIWRIMHEDPQCLEA